VPIAELVERVGDGDEEAWASLVEELSPLLWVVAKSFRLGDALAEDVCQTVWVRLIENVADLRRPDRVEAWLVTTCKREALRVKAALERMGTMDGWDVPSNEPNVDDRLIRDESRRLVAQAFNSLDERCRELLRMFVAHPPLRYREIAETMGMAVGSVGPVRQRCLKQLRVAMEAIT
jgi:RNA polymerase sigma factor (sigma-70 family)